MSDFPHLFWPLQIGSITVRNRIAMGPHLTGYAVDQCPSERHAYYYAERAKGGVGLIITETIAVHPHSSMSAQVVLGYDRRVIPGYRRIADVIHEHGAKVVGQLMHQGREYSSFHSRLALWAPSGVPSPHTRETPHEMERDEIREVQEGFVQTAANLKEAGYDGVELHAGHGFLIHQFMSPWCNARQDEYGGSLENRLRFACETIAAVRQRVGPEFVVGIRVSGDEFTPGGLTLDDMKVVAERLAATGQLDYISITVGNQLTRGVQMADMNMPLAAMAYMSAAIKELVALPVFIALRINDPVVAEKIVADGQADMTVMVRALIADPELPNKAREGRLDDIRRCIACNQECRRGNRNGAVTCLQNVAAGYEKEWGVGTLAPAAKRKKVLVIGGGPGGMEAARIAALRGHSVSLHERNAELGGQINIAVKVPNREEMGNVVRFLRHEVERLGVTVHLGREADVQTVLAEQADAVVVATGSKPHLPELPGCNGPNVVTVVEVLEGRAPVGERVVIVDGGDAFWQCCASAEYLAGQGKRVEIVTPVLYVGMEVPGESLGGLYQRLLSKEAVFTPSTGLKEIRQDGGRCTLVVYNTYSKREREIVGVDTVVMATGARADDGLYRALKGRVPELYAVGDCYAPRKIPDAIRDGQRVGRMV